MDKSNLIRNRALAALVFDHPMPYTPPDYGITSKVAQITREAVLLVTHASRVEKLWETDKWIKLGRHRTADGLAVELTWGNATERNRAGIIATACGGSVAPFYTGQDLLNYVAGFKGMISLDTGLAHVGAMLGVPGVTLFYNAALVTQWKPNGAQQTVITNPASADPKLVHGHLLELLD